MDRSFWRFNPPPLPGTEWKTPWQMEISLIHINVSFRRITSTYIMILLCMFFLKNNQLKNILMSKRLILGWHIPFPFRSKKKEAAYLNEAGENGKEGRKETMLFEKSPEVFLSHVPRPLLAAREARMGFVSASHIATSKQSQNSEVRWKESRPECILEKYLPLSAPPVIRKKVSEK